MLPSFITSVRNEDDENYLIDWSTATATDVGNYTIPISATLTNKNFAVSNNFDLKVTILLRSICTESELPITVFAP